MVVLVLGVGFCVLVLRQKNAFASLYVYSPFVLIGVPYRFVLFSLFPIHRNFVVSETTVRSYLVFTTAVCFARGLVGPLGGDVRSGFLHWLLKAS